MISVSITLIAKEPQSEEAIVLKSTLFFINPWKFQVWNIPIQIETNVKGHLAVFLSNESTMFLNYR